ncbi:hypothetical protein HMPREF0972_02441 [Actinomyces sp. oral taxon 848 str. F0332]|nr:hypothetical protein HMPREF0972_02441 [Actinomyces sp. oral taxon 848 str. F0332]
MSPLVESRTTAPPLPHFRLDARDALAVSPTRHDAIGDNSPSCCHHGVLRKRSVAKTRRGAG